MEKQVEAITKITKALEELTPQESHRVINFVQSSIYDRQECQGVAQAETVVMETESGEEVMTATVEAKPKKAKKAKKVKEPEVQPTLEEMTTLCRETAERLKSGPKVKALIEKVCEVSSLKEADESTFITLQKLLKDAK